MRKITLVIMLLFVLATVSAQDVDIPSSSSSDSFSSLGTWIIPFFEPGATGDEARAKTYAEVKADIHGGITPFSATGADAGESPIADGSGDWAWGDPSTSQLVVSDSTLTGGGITGSALAVANPFTGNPFTNIDEGKLDGIEALADVTDQANVYTAVKAIIADGANITTTDDDSAMTITFAGQAGGGTSTSFLGHSDTPDSYTSAVAGQVIAVNSGRTALIYADSGGISQSDADARYVELAGDTMTSTLNVTPDDDSVALFLDATALTSQTPFVFNINSSGNQQAFWLRRGTDAQAWLTIDGNIGGNNDNPGFALGPGGTAARDVLLYRGGDDLLTTPDSFSVGGDLTVTGDLAVTGSYGLAAGDIPTIPSGRVSGLGTAAVLNTGVASGNVPVLDSNGKLATSTYDAGSGGGGVTTYTGLSDTSSSYGTTRQVPAVNTNSDGLEWIDVSESTRANIYSHHAIFVPGDNMSLAKDGNNENITFNVIGIEDFAKTAETTTLVPATRLAANPANNDLLRYETDAPAWGPKFFTPDSTGDCPTPPHGAVNMAICTKDDGIYYATERIVNSTDPTGTWAVVDGDTTNESTIKAGFLGAVVDIHSGTPTPSFADASFVFDLSTSHFYAVTRSTIDTSNVYWSQREDPSDWLGIGSLGELLNRASAIGDWGYDETQHEIEYLSAFTAGTVEEELGEWTSITPIGGYPLAANVVGLEDFIDNDLHNFDSPNESYLSPGNGITFTAGTPANPKLSINAVPEYAADWIGDNYIMVGGALSLAVVDADVTNNIDRSLTITNLNPLLPDAGNGNTRVFLAADLDLTGPPTLAWTPPSAAPFSTYYTTLYNRLKDTVLVGGTTITITSDDSAGTLTISGPPAGSGEANPQRITTAEAGSFINATLTDGDTLRSWSQNLFRQSVYGSIRSGGASATTTIRGTVEYATNNEVVASTPATNKVITPANLAHWGTARITDGALLTGSTSSESTSIAPSRQTVAEMGASIIQGARITDGDLSTSDTSSESTSIAPSRQSVAEMGAAIISQIGSGGGGGGGTPAARILLGSRVINDDDTPYTIVFTEGVPRGYLLQIQYGANPMIYAEISSDAILSLTQSAATPTNLNNGINLKTSRIGEGALFAVWARANFDMEGNQ